MCQTLYWACEQKHRLKPMEYNLKECPLTPILHTQNYWDRKKKSWMGFSGSNPFRNTMFIGMGG